MRTSGQGEVVAPPWGWGQGSPPPIRRAPAAEPVRAVERRERDVRCLLAFPVPISKTRQKKSKNLQKRLKLLKNTDRFKRVWEALGGAQGANPCQGMGFCKKCQNIGVFAYCVCCVRAL